ncbi:MAG: ATP-binding cassette domain-containing protein [Pseudomonadota bacterium]
MAAVSGPLRIRVDAKRYPAVADRAELPVLSRVDLSVEPGSFVVITGPSGCGKSTLLNIVAGLDDDYEGSVAFGSDSPRLSFMFQTPRLLPWRTVRQNIELVMPDDDPSNAQRIDDMLAAVGLSGQESQYPERLSLGMQRRAALARAFIVEPDILLMDEPFVSLDDPTAAALRDILMGLWDKRPTTVLFVTHDRGEAIMLGTRLIRVGGQPATVISDQQVSLSRKERGDREAVHRMQAELFAS